MDETGSIGPMFNLMKDYGIGTAYYTDGQEVPEDITEADSKKLISLVIRRCLRCVIRRKHLGSRC